jgi:hypothetical protein
VINRVSLPPSFAFGSLPAPLPAGYLAAPITPEQVGAALRVCVLIKSDAKPGSAAFAMLRDTLDARVYLGCLLDASERVHKWLEVAVQDAAGLGSAPIAYRDALSNGALDARWERVCRSSPDLLMTGYEFKSPPPIFIDAKTRLPSVARDKRTNATWALCTDEAILARKGVPAYTSTLSRHLFQPELGDGADLMPMDVLGNDPSALAAALGLAGDPIPFNPSCGRMMVRPLAALTLEQYADALKGVSSDAGPGESVLRSIAAASSHAGPGNVGGYLRASGVGMAGRLVESLHLHLMALAGAISDVRTAVAASQSPLLNLSAQSFRVAIQSGSPAIPLWWTASVQLNDSGDAAELTIPGSKNHYFLPGHSGGGSIYAPTSMARAISGKGWLRPRNVIAEGTGMVVEATLSTQERVSAGPNDLLWLRAGVGGGRFDLYTFVDTQSSMAGGEIRVRSLPQKLSDDTLNKLRAGTPISDVGFELVPMLSTPCDLYALGVLAVRVLLVGGKQALPVALDEMLSLAAAAAALSDTGLELPERIAQVFESDKRFGAALGPQILLADAHEGGPAQAFEAIPPRLWFSTLAMIVRMFSGLGPDSRSKDFGDAPAGAIHRVFDGPLDDLSSLLSGCRSLIVPDHALNSEVRSVLAECLAGLR